MNKKELVEQSKKETFDRRLKLCKDKAAVGDSVLFYKEGEVIKKGVVTKLTSIGAHIFDTNRKGGDFEAAGPDNAEWFPFQNKVNGKLGGIILV